VQLGLLEVLAVGNLGLALTPTMSVWEIVPRLFVYG
jgi:hypothetical protein